MTQLENDKKQFLGKKKVVVIGIVFCIIAIILIGIVINLNRITSLVSGEKTIEDIVIETPYGVLTYPGTRKDNLRTESIEEDSYVVAFYGSLEAERECHLFDIVFGEMQENVVGMLRVSEEETIPVGVVTYEITDSEGCSMQERELFYEMQDELNYVLEKLELVDVVVEDARKVNTGISEETTEAVLQRETEDGDIEITTPYCTLYYSGKWKDSVYTEVVTSDEMCTVEFYGRTNSVEQQHLFDIVFGGTEGEMIGALEEEQLDVFMIVQEYNQEGNIPQEEIDELYAMMEEVNYVVEKLSQEEGFIPVR